MSENREGHSIVVGSINVKTSVDENGKKQINIEDVARGIEDFYNPQKKIIEGNFPKQENFEAGNPVVKKAVNLIKEAGLTLKDFLINPSEEREEELDKREEIKYAKKTNTPIQVNNVIYGVDFKNKK